MQYEPKEVPSLVKNFFKKVIDLDLCPQSVNLKLISQSAIHVARKICEKSDL